MNARNIQILPLELARDLWASLHARKLSADERGNVTATSEPPQVFNPDELILYTELTKRFARIAQGLEVVNVERIAGILLRSLDERALRGGNPRPDWKELTGLLTWAIEEASR